MIELHCDVGYIFVTLLYSFRDIIQRYLAIGVKFDLYLGEVSVFYPFFQGEIWKASLSHKCSTFVKVEHCPHAESELYQLESGGNKTEGHCCKKTKRQMVLLNLPEFFDIVAKLHIDCIHVANSVALPRCIVCDIGHRV